MQHMLARSVFAAGIMQRAAEPLGWHDWAKIGACMVFSFETTSQ